MEQIIARFTDSSRKMESESSKRTLVYLPISSITVCDEHSQCRPMRMTTLANLLKEVHNALLVTPKLVRAVAAVDPSYLTMFILGRSEMVEVDFEKMWEADGRSICSVLYVIGGQMEIPFLIGLLLLNRETLFKKCLEWLRGWGENVEFVEGRVRKILKGSQEPERLRN
jgi:hypothetical protein